jgi:N-acetylneuraminate synthase
VLLKCTSTYPATPLNSNVRTIPHLRELFGCEVGLSDHSMGVGVSVAAVALGATVVEKHFTLDRSAGGVDASFSLEPAELASLVVETERAWQAMGQVHYGVTEAERKSLVYRRSLYVTADMAAGEPFPGTICAPFALVSVCRPSTPMPSSVAALVRRSNAARRWTGRWSNNPICHRFGKIA